MGKLDNKICIITGGASGLGKQHALRFADEGANLAICDVREERLMETKKLCEERGAEVVALRCDVSVYDDLVKLVDATIEKFGTIDVLVNNAHKVTPLVPFLEQEFESLQVELGTSLFATWHLMKLCYPHMKNKPGAGASVINVASKGGMEGTPFHAAYAAAKEGIRGLTRVTARELGQYNIRVNTVAPGGFTDNASADLHKQSKEVIEWAEKAFKNNPMQRAGDPYNDVSPIFVFLASDDSHWMTGQNLNADGGGWIAP